MATLDELLQAGPRIKSPGAVVQNPAAMSAPTATTANPAPIQGQAEAMTEQAMPGSQARRVTLEDKYGPVKSEFIRGKAAVRDAWQDEKAAIKETFGRKPAAPATTDAGAPAPASGASGSGQQPAGTFAELVNQLSPYKPKTPEEQAAEERRQKRNLTFSAIGDTVSALSNLYFTTQYAPNMFNPKESMTERHRSRYDKMNAQDKADQANYLNFMLGAKDKDQQAADRAAALQVQIQQGRDNAAAAEAKAEEDKRRWEAEFGLKKDKQDADAATAAAKAEEDKRRWDAEHALKLRKQAAAERKAAGQSGSGSGSGNGKKVEPITLSNGSAKGNKGSQFKIHPDVWAGAMPYIFNTLAQEAIKAGKKSEWDFKQMKAADQENYVKQHWNESEAAKQMLEYYSTIDPETMESFTDPTEGAPQQSIKWYPSIYYGMNTEEPIMYRPE